MKSTLQASFFCFFFCFFFFLLVFSLKCASPTDLGRALRFIKKLDLSHLMCTVDLYATFTSSSSTPSTTPSSNSLEKPSEASSGPSSSRNTSETLPPTSATFNSVTASPLGLIYPTSISSERQTISTHGEEQEPPSDGSSEHSSPSSDGVSPLEEDKSKPAQSYILPSSDFKEPPKRSHFVLLTKKRSKGSLNSKGSVDSQSKGSKDGSSETGYGSTDAEDSSGSEQIGKVQRNLLGGMSSAVSVHNRAFLM